MLSIYGYCYYYLSCLLFCFCCCYKDIFFELLFDIDDSLCCCCCDLLGLLLLLHTDGDGVIFLIINFLLFLIPVHNSLNFSFISTLKLSSSSSDYYLLLKCFCWFRVFDVSLLFKLKFIIYFFSMILYLKYDCYIICQLVS